MATRAQVATLWVGTGTTAEDPHRPKVTDDYPPQTWEDVTGTPASNIVPSPNGLVIEGVWDDTAFAALSADANYQGAIIWSEPA